MHSIQRRILTNIRKTASLLKYKKKIADKSEEILFPTLQVSKYVCSPILYPCNRRDRTEGFVPLPKRSVTVMRGGGGDPCQVYKKPISHYIALQEHEELF